MKTGNWVSVLSPLKPVLYWAQIVHFLKSFMGSFVIFLYTIPIVEEDHLDPFLLTWAIECDPGTSKKLLSTWDLGIRIRI